MTTGTHESRPFSKDTVKSILKNRFFIGYIRDGKGGWRKAKHKSFIDPELFEEANKIREKRITSKGTIRSDARIYSLSGIVRCAECGSTLRAFSSRGKVRLVCNGRLNRGDCKQPSSLLETYE